MKDYNQVKLTGRDMLLTLSKGFLIILVISYLFFDNLLFSILLLPILYIVWKKEKIKICHDQKWRLNLEFKEAIESVLAALMAGYSIENSFLEAEKDLMLLYDSKDSDMMQELHFINSQVLLNQRLEDLLQDFARRSHVEDIINFTEVFLMAKRSGGNLSAILNRTMSNIAEKIEVSREIDTMITGKKLESGIMNIIPAGIVLYLRVFSGEFLSPLYHNLLGNGIMIGVLAFYGLGIYMSSRIVNIQV